MQNCYNQGELKSRLAKTRVDIWYLPSLTKNDVTKFEEVRRVLFVDAINCLEWTIKSIN